MTETSAELYYGNGRIYSLFAPNATRTPVVNEIGAFESINWIRDATVACVDLPTQELADLGNRCCIENDAVVSQAA